MSKSIQYSDDNIIGNVDSLPGLRNIYFDKELQKDVISISWKIYNSISSGEPYSIVKFYFRDGNLIRAKYNGDFLECRAGINKINIQKHAPYCNYVEVELLERSK